MQVCNYKTTLTLNNYNQMPTPITVNNLRSIILLCKSDYCMSHNNLYQHDSFKALQRLFLRHLWCSKCKMTKILLDTRLYLQRNRDWFAMLYREAKTRKKKWEEKNRPRINIPNAIWPNSPKRTVTSLCTLRRERILCS